MVINAGGGVQRRPDAPAARINTNVLREFSEHRSA